MFYSVEEHVCVATSDSPLGPFVQDEKKPIREEKGIDTSVFFDEDGKAYLYFVRFTNGNVIWCAELKDNLKEIKEETLTQCVEATEPWELVFGKVVEGPSIVKQGGLYYMFYSANDFRSNGAGKSTLLKILAGVREPTRGKVSAPKDTVIAYLPQHLMTEDGRTVFEETAQAFAHLHEMEAEIAALNKELETRTDYESDSYMELIERVSTLSEKFYSIEEINYDADIEKTLLGLGFTREDFNRQTSEFSGGWRMRIELAKLLLKKPDVLLLDEPTNHLDIESIQWLEDFLIDNGQAVVVISHDRAFCGSYHDSHDRSYDGAYL